MKDPQLENPMDGAPDRAAGRDAFPGERLRFLTGGGEAGALMRGLDWSKSPLGPPASWPQSLRSVVGLLLNSRFPMFVAWGPELGFLYNDSYAEVLGAKHPAAMGRPFREVWSEIWADISPLIDSALAGEATYSENLPLLMNRKGYDEPTWFTFSYSPVLDETGRAAGMFCACTETTGQVLADRFQTFRIELETLLATCTDPREVTNAAVELLGRRLNASRVGYSEIQADDATVVMTSCYADGVAPLLGVGRLDDFGAESVDRQRAGRTEIVEDLLADPAQVHDTWRALDTRAMVSVPLVRGGRLRGSLYVNVREPRRWTGHEIAIIELVASRTWEAVERARAEVELRESEARFRLMADAVPQIIWITDADGRVEFFNRQWSAYTGATYAPGTAAEVAADFIHPDDGQASIDAFRAARDAGAAYVAEHRIRSASGAYRWFLVRAEPYVDPATGKIVRWFGASVDIHDRREAEARLHELNRTLEEQVAARSAERDRLWNLSQDMLARADFDGMMSAVSPAWSQVLGWSESELLARGYATFMHPDDTAPTLAALERMAETGQATRFENRIATRDGGWRNIEWTVAPEADGENFIAVGRDVSAARAREAELKSAQEALRQSQKMEAMGQLTGGVAHDFNNLLSPIIGGLDILLRRGVGDERDRRLIDGALQSAERAKTLVQRLLAFARRQPLQARAVDLGKLVAGMAELVDSTSGPNVFVQVRIDSRVPAVRADANQLEMAILNLAVNARDAMPDGGTLAISAAPDSGTAAGLPARREGYVRLSVEDTGHGMDEATRARAIEPFFSTKGLGRGTGLGLSMVQGLALQLGGGFAIDSAPGQGTRISLWLPVSSEPPAEVEAVAASAPLDATRGAALVVDDEDLVRLTTADMLADLGYEVVEARSGEQALELVEAGLEPVLVVTDHLMPGVDGVQLARRLSARRPDLPILIVSGYAEGEGLVPDLARLTKPFRKADLVRSLAALRERGAARPE